MQPNAAGWVELKLKTPWRDGATHLTMSGLEVMRRQIEWQLCGSQIRERYVGSGSEAPVRDHRMQPFDAETAETFGRPPRTTAAAIAAFLGGASERQVPR